MTGISSETANDDSTRRMQDEGKLVVSVCHGPAGLLPAIRADGTWVFQGYRLTSFTNTEEAAVGLRDADGVIEHGADHGLDRQIGMQE